MKNLFLFLVFGLSQLALAQQEHSLVRRVSVFPLKTPSYLSQAADESWWQIREALTENKRFLVASKNFLIQKDVFQARGELSPADGIILGRLLDANALIVTFLEGRLLSMKVYEGEYGQLLWQHQFEMHPSIPIENQLPGAARKLVMDFMASIPYHGFVFIDPLIGQPTFTGKSKLMAKAEIGLNTDLDVGDEVQFIRIIPQNFKPLFADGGLVETIAVGKVTQIEREILTIEITKIADGQKIKEFTLIRLPREYQRLKQAFTIGDRLKKQVDPQFLSVEMRPTEEQVKENKPLVATLAFISNLAAFLLLAF